MTIDEINTIRLALDTPEHNRHYVKHTTDAKIILNKEQEAINYTRCSTELPVDKLQELIDETYTWQVQDIDSDTFEETLKIGIREGALATKHYIDDKRKAIT